MPSKSTSMRPQLRPGADFNQRDQPCLALFDRGEMQSKLEVQGLGVLTSLDVAVDWLDERRAALV